MTTTIESCTSKRCTKRLHVPFYEQANKKIHIINMANKNLQNKDWNKDPFIRKLRNKGAIIQRYYASNGMYKNTFIPPRCPTIRLERKQTLSCCASALLDYANYSLDPDYVLEVNCSIEHIAAVTGQLHISKPTEEHPQGRKSYDCTINCLKDLEGAGGIYLATEYDKEKQTHKASRIFLTPIFFEMCNITPKMLKKLVRNKYNKKLRSNEIEANAKYKLYLKNRASNLRISKVKNSQLINKLREIKKFFTTEEIKEDENLTTFKKNVNTKKTTQIKTKEAKINKSQQPKINNSIILRDLKTLISPANVYLLTEKIKLENLNRGAFEIAMIREIRAIIAT